MCLLLGRVCVFFFFFLLMIRRPPRSTLDRSSAASDVYKRQGYKDVKPMVYSGLYPTDSDDFEDLRDALEKFCLNDSALIYQPETCLLYTSPSPRDRTRSRMPSSA